EVSTGSGSSPALSVSVNSWKPKVVSEEVVSAAAGASWARAGPAATSVHSRRAQETSEGQRGVLDPITPPPLRDVRCRTCASFDAGSCGRDPDAWRLASH